VVDVDAPLQVSGGQLATWHRSGRRRPEAPGRLRTMSSACPAAVRRLAHALARMWRGLWR